MTICSLGYLGCLLSLTHNCCKTLRRFYDVSEGPNPVLRIFEEILTLLRSSSKFEDILTLFIPIWIYVLKLILSTCCWGFPQVRGIHQNLRIYSILSLKTRGFSRTKSRKFPWGFTPRISSSLFITLNVVIMLFRRRFVFCEIVGFGDKGIKISQYLWRLL